ncbi:oligoendopeptidase F [Shimazuella kribbensis]|uniref:oligoendopeptidase F n=1 Tax=Shimazuella kribbensis TaxID=139808 RepID=UPI00042588AD|nr:oligoendopeptidase F [Shimazuella kribbensis]
MSKLPLRSEQDKAYQWRLETIFPTNAAWEEEFAAVKKLIPSLRQFEGKLAESASAFYKALSTRDELSLRIGKLFVYARMRYDQDTTDSHYQAYNDRASTLTTEAGSALAYLRPEILAIDPATIQSFLQSEPKLQVYAYELAELDRFRPHVLSTKEEAILAEASEVLGASRNTYGLLNNADMKFPTIQDDEGKDIEITHGRMIQLLENTNARVRKDTFHAVYDTYGGLKNTFASTLSSHVKKHNLVARLRHYDSARQRSLSGNNIPEKVYDQLIAIVHENLPLLHRYIKLRKKAMGVKELHMYDLYTPFISHTPKKITYDQAKETVIRGLAPLGKEYTSTLQQAFRDGWIDVYENQGKRSGAYSFGTYGTNPFVLMNWQDNMDNMFTLAHELGHSMHSFYTRKTQPYVYGDYSIFVAEVASTCNEAILSDYLLQTTTDRNDRLYLLNHQVDKFRGTVFRQTMFAEFELLIHQRAQNGEALTAETLTKMYYELNKKYFGDEIMVDEQIGLEWSRIPHFYYDFYVYQYATGTSAAMALAKQILEEGKPAVDRYLTFLSSGSSAGPIEVLQRAGVDMTKPHPIRSAFDVYEGYLDELEELL